MTFCHTEFGYLLKLESGDELVRSLIQFARAQEIDAAVIAGSGTIAEAEIGAGGVHEREHRRRTLMEPLVACSITGTLTLVDGEPFPHLHGTFARADHSLLGGHVYQAVTGESLEIAVQLTAVPLATATHAAFAAPGTTP